MLILRRGEGEWTEVRHEATGDLIRVRVFNVGRGRADLAFEDDARLFAVLRPEWHGPAGATAGPLARRLRSLHAKA